MCAGRSTHALFSHGVSSISGNEVVGTAQNDTDHECMPCFHDKARFLILRLVFGICGEVFGGCCSECHKWPRKFLFQTIRHTSPIGNMAGYLFQVIDSRVIYENLKSTELETKKYGKRRTS